MEIIKRNLLRILIWALVLGVLSTLLADWGEWDRFGVNLLWRILIVAVGGIVGIILNYFGSNYVSMGTNVVESMGLTKFSGDTLQKIENSFIFVGAFLGTIVALLFI